MFHRLLISIVLMFSVSLAQAGGGLDVYFLRHAQTMANASGVTNTRTSSTFSDEGLAQIDKLTEALKSYHFDAILVSPTERTQQTIRPYLEQSGNKAETWQEITECCWQHDPGNSAYAAGAAQVHKAANTLRERYAQSGKSILIVAHYHSGQVLLADLLGVARESLPGLENARITHLKQDANGAFSIVSINVAP